MENRNVPPPVETNQADRSRDQNVPRGSGPGVQPTIRVRPLGQWIGRTRDCCVRIICEVSGEPTPVVTWKRNGRTLNTGSSTGTYSVESSGSLKICTSNHRGHSGTYRCEAANRHGSAYREVSLHASHSGESSPRSRVRFCVNKPLRLPLRSARHTSSIHSRPTGNHSM